MEGRIGGKKGKGRLRRSYLDKIKERVDVASYLELKIRVLDRWLAITSPTKT